MNCRIRTLLVAFELLSMTLGYSQSSPKPFPILSTNEEGFALAVPGVELDFPRDHGAHLDFKNEWWYLTGHLESKNKAESFGFQLTFFRAAVGGEQSYLAHAAIFNKNDGKFLHEERLNSGLWNADATDGSLNVFNGNWYLRMTDNETEGMVARFSLADFGVLNLSLKPQKPKVLFGKDGYSKKGAERGAASYYTTFSRLKITGILERGSESPAIEGIAWMDHEFSSSQLSEGQIGWNWTSLILDDGREIMAYVMRRKDGAKDSFSVLNIIETDGSARKISSEDFEWLPQRYWESPDGSLYPVEYLITWQDETGANSIRVEALADEQEIRDRIGGFVYWEGASKALDANGNRIGLGYTELTGYNESLQGRF